MASPLQQHAVVGRFSCLGAECPDTCCAGWDMPVDQVQLTRYEIAAPELLATVNLTHGIMKREAANQQCGQLCEGICAIQKNYGSDFLGDSCHFYPRIVHAIGERQLMVGSTSCPEMLRLILNTRDPFAASETTLERMPGIRRNILPEGWTDEELHLTMQQFMALAQEEARTPEQIITTIIDTACEAQQEDTAAKPINAHSIYYALALTDAFSDQPRRPALDSVMRVMEQKLGCAFDRTSRTISFAPDAATHFSLLAARWNMDARHALAPVLRRWIQAQLAMTAFPFGGLPGLTIIERTALLAQRFATMRLGLMCHVEANGIPPDEITTIRVIQVLSRFLDHLADAKLTKMIQRDLGWTTPAQLHALIR